MLVLSKFLPPLLTPRQGQPLQQLRLALREATVPFERVPSVPVELLSQKRHHGAQTDSRHFAMRLGLFCFDDLASSLLELLHARCLLL